MPVGGRASVWSPFLQAGQKNICCRPPLAVLGAALLGVLLVGCNRTPDVVVERVPKSKISPSAVAARTQSLSQPQRTLAAIVLDEQAGQAYFLKLAGEPEALDAYRKPFLELVRSFDVDASADSPDWTVPEGWEELDRPGGKMRLATLVIPGDPPLDVAITSLNISMKDHQAYRVLNVNRWRRQLGLEPIEASDIAEQPGEQDHIFQLKLDNDDGQATVVDIRGVSQGGGMGAPFAHSRGVSASPHGASGGRESKSNLSYDLPAGWEKSAGSLISAAAFAADGAEVTITALSAKSNDLLLNVNRWRGQVKLPPTTPEKLQDQVKTITLGDGKEGAYVVLLVPGKKSLLGVIAERGQTVWFIKMVGKQEATVAEQQPKFEAFVESLRFGASR